MSETAILWLFGIAGAWLALLSATVLKLLITQVKITVAVNLFVDSLGEKLAKALHADDDHLKIDSLLDKYLDRHYELSFQEWAELKNRCNDILNNEKVSVLERSLAGMLASVCEHKLMVKFGTPMLTTNISRK